MPLLVKAAPEMAVPMSTGPSLGSWSPVWGWLLPSRESSGQDHAFPNSTASPGWGRGGLKELGMEPETMPWLPGEGLALLE